MGIVGISFFGANVWYSGLILSSPAIVVENFSSPIRGMKRSWELSTGSRCYVLSTMIALSLMKQFLAYILQQVFGDFVGGIMSLLCLAFYLPLRAILETVLYLN